MSVALPPNGYWHCSVKVSGTLRSSVVNDLPLEALIQTIVEPWRAGRAFPVSGMIVKPGSDVASIKIVHTEHPKAHYAEQHNVRMRMSGIADLATNRALLPLSEGTDFTYDLLFGADTGPSPSADVALVEQICRRLPHAARILTARSRAGKSPLTVADEYDVQDLLHAVLRAYLKYSVQEDPLPKVAASKSGRADVSIEELGILIEVKFARGPNDQKRIFEEYSQDLVLYAKWPPIKALIFLVYNSSDLRDPEALEKLSSMQEVAGKRFDVRVVLA